MYRGKIVNIGNSYFVHVINASIKQKIYPLSNLSAINILDSQDSKFVKVELIPNNSESDEQVEYIARIVEPKK